MDETITIAKEEYDRLKELEGKNQKLPILLYESFSRGEKSPETFSQDDLLRIDEALRQRKVPQNVFGVFSIVRNVTIFYTLYFLALRPKEACCLRFNDLDLEKGLIKIRGENNKQGMERIIPIPKQLIFYFRKYLAHPRYLWKGSSYLFPSSENEFLSAARWKAIFRDALKIAGLWIKPEEGSYVSKTRSYTLRHTRATELLTASNMDIHAVSNILGHKELSSTQRYLHKNPNYQEYLRSLLEKGV